MDTLRLGSLVLQCHIFLPYHTIHGVLMAKILEWFAIPSSSGLNFVRTLHYDPSVLASPIMKLWLIASLSFASPFAMTKL